MFVDAFKQSYTDELDPVKEKARTGRSRRPWLITGDAYESFLVAGYAREPPFQLSRFMNSRRVLGP